jgi:hypothetical protein
MNTRTDAFSGLTGSYYGGCDPYDYRKLDCSSIKIIHDTILIEPASSMTAKPIDCGLEFRTIPKFKL